MILTGLGGIVVVEIYAAVMQRCFQNTDNQVGKGFAILGIYLFVVIHCKQKALLILMIIKKQLRFTNLGMGEKQMVC